MSRKNNTQQLENPKQVVIEQTNRCNNKCLQCAHNFMEFGEDISDKVAQKAIDALVEGAWSVTIQAGGESLIAEPFYKILEACKQKGTQASFTTNAIKLRDRELFRKLVLFPVGIFISIDGASEETFTFTRYKQKCSHYRNLRKYSKY